MLVLIKISSYLVADAAMVHTPKKSYPISPLDVRSTQTGINHIISSLECYYRFACYLFFVSNCPMIENPTPVYYEKNIFCSSQWGGKSILLLSKKISSNSSFTTFLC